MAKTPTLPRLQQATAHAAGDVPTLTDGAAMGADPTERPITKLRRTSGAMILILIIAIVANLAIIAVIASRADPAPAITVRPRVPTPPAGPPAPSEVPPRTAATSFGEGRFVVGTDIAPGTYRTTGKSGHLDCYWERLKDTNGTTSIIANDLVSGPATVTIDKTDTVFQTRRCNSWTKVG